jgi:histidinol dehydrogenase
MAPNTATASDALAEREVMASVDDNGRTERLIIADTTADGAWLSVPVSGSAPLREWQ